ncbi:MAG: FAD-containing oxidoreductase [Kofleriaceae bacterium]|nr:FAD-containing oxidoreductase [Kofleriaceae bacterium]
MTKEYDAIIIGTGQAGPSLADRFNSEGKTVAIIERGKFGGTCVNYGCIPTKALVASARAAHMARRGADFGVIIDGPVRIDMKRVHERMKEISGKSNKGVTGSLEGMKNVDIYQGDASFHDSNTVSVNGELLQSDKIFLNVGTRARAPQMPGLEQIDFLTNKELLALDEVPEHLIIIGGSYIGLEFAQIFRRFGSEVTVIERASSVIAREDEDVSGAIKGVLEREGIAFRCNADCIAFEKRGEQVAVQVSCDTDASEVVGSHVLLAIGRVPNTDTLKLDKAGVEINERGYITVDDQLRTNVPGIWALGDVNGEGAFSHTSYNDYEIAAANLFDDDPRRVSDRISVYGLYVDPPLGRIGMTEEQARKSGRNVLIGKRLMTRVGRAVERGETDGFIKVLVDADTKEILGAAILGIGGDEVVHSLLTAMYAKAPYTVISRAVHIHPTVSELVPTTLQNLKPLTPH